MRWIRTIAFAAALTALALAPAEAQILEFRFNEPDTLPNNWLVTNYGTNTTKLTLRDHSGDPTDLHSPAGSGVTEGLGLPESARDRAFDNRAAGVGGTGFDGRGSYADQPHNADLDDLKSFTLCTWYKAPSPLGFTAVGTLFSTMTDVAGADTSGVALALVSGPGADGLCSAELRVNFSSRSTTGRPFPTTAGKWVFIAVTYDGTASTDNVKLYRGYRSQDEAGTQSPIVTLVGTLTIDQGSVAPSSTRFHLGNRILGSRWRFDGYLDNARVYGSKTDASGVLDAEDLDEIRKSDLSARRRVILIDGKNDDFTNDAEGYFRAGGIRSQDLLQFTRDSLALGFRSLRDYDTLIVVAHGGIDGKFVWNGRSYTDFGAGAGKYPVPGWFAKLRRIVFQFVSCYSTRTTDSQGNARTSMVQRLTTALGGTDRGHVGSGFMAIADATVFSKIRGGRTEQEQTDAFNFLRQNRDWQNYPPINRPGTGGANQPKNQKTAAERDLAIQFGAAAAKSMSMIIEDRIADWNPPNGDAKSTGYFLWDKPGGAPALALFGIPEEDTVGCAGADAEVLPGPIAPIELTAPRDTLLPYGQLVTLTFCLANRGDSTRTLEYVLRDPLHWLLSASAPTAGSVSIAPGDSFCITATVRSGCGVAAADSLRISSYPAEPFVISDSAATVVACTGTTAVPSSAGSGPRFELRPVAPNPTRGALRVGFVLPQRAPVRLELLDIAGRRITRRELGELDAGAHDFPLRMPDGSAAGIYFVRLEQAGRRATTRFLLLP